MFVGSSTITQFLLMGYSMPRGEHAWFVIVAIVLSTRTSTVEYLVVLIVKLLMMRWGVDVKRMY